MVIQKHRCPADGQYVSATAFLPHQVRTTPRDLEALARVWKWEGTIQRRLPQILASGGFTILFQAIFDIRGEFPLLRAYEALARFPVERRIPTGLWFNIADQMGLRLDLELATARRALDMFHRLPDEILLFVNISPSAAPMLADEVSRALAERVVLDLPAVSMAHPDLGWVPGDLRWRGLAMAFDDMPLSQESLRNLAASHPMPEYLQIDLASANEVEDPRDLLKAAVEWCHISRITLVAKRVERATQLYALREMGFDWAQGYSLARPTEL